MAHSYNSYYYIYLQHLLVFLPRFIFSCLCSSQHGRKPCCRSSLAYSTSSVNSRKRCQRSCSHNPWKTKQCLKTCWLKFQLQFVKCKLVEHRLQAASARISHCFVQCFIWSEKCFPQMLSIWLFHSHYCHYLPLIAAAIAATRIFTVWISEPYIHMSFQWCNRIAVIAQALVSQSHPVHVAQLRHDPGKGKVVMRWLWWSFDGFLLVQLDGVFSILHSPGIAVPSSLLPLGGQLLLSHLSLQPFQLYNYSWISLFHFRARLKGTSCKSWRLSLRCSWAVVASLSTFFLWGPWPSFWKWSSDVSDLEQTRFWKSSPIMWRIWKVNNTGMNRGPAFDLRFQFRFFYFHRTKFPVLISSDVGFMLASGFSEGYHRDHWPCQRNPPDQRDHQLLPQKGVLANGDGALGQSSTRSFFRSLNFKSHDGQTKSGTSDLLKVNFTLESLLDFQRSHHTHAVVGCGFEKVPGDVSLGHHKRPNYNNQQRRLLAKGRQHSEQLVSN